MLLTHCQTVAPMNRRLRAARIVPLPGKEREGIQLVTERENLGGVQVLPAAACLIIHPGKERKAILPKRKAPKNVKLSTKVFQHCYDTTSMKDLNVTAMTSCQVHLMGWVHSGKDSCRIF